MLSWVDKRQLPHLKPKFKLLFLMLKTGLKSMLEHNDGQSSPPFKPPWYGPIKAKGWRRTRKILVPTRYYLRRVNPILLSLSTGLANIDRIDKVACYILYAF